MHFILGVHLAMGKKYVIVFKWKTGKKVLRVERNVSEFLSIFIFFLMIERMKIGQIDFSTSILHFLETRLRR